MTRLGATITGDGAACPVWAPGHERVDVLIDGEDHAMTAEDGYFVATLPRVGAGTRYRYRIDGKDAHPDPCSRFQPEGPHEASEVIDASAYAWRDEGWR